MLKVLLNKVNLIKDRNEKIVLKNISFESEAGNIYTILGKNGSGKSTLLKSFTALLDKRFYSVDGEVIYKGIDILSMNESELQNIRRNEIKYVFQDPVNSFDHLKKFKYYFNLSNIKDTEELLEFFLLPDSNTLFKMYPYEVSGGMAQRISFILTLLAEPKIILLDEPTSGIDAPVINLLLIKLREFVNEGNLVLMVTHDIQLAKSASNKIALLSDFTLSGFVSPEAFLKQFSLTTVI